MKDIKIYNYIDNLIKDFLVNQHESMPLTINNTVQLGDESFELNIWQENIDNQLIQIFELRKRGRIFDSVYTKGILFSNDSYRVLSNEEMWNYGF